MEIGIVWDSKPVAGFISKISHTERISSILLVILFNGVIFIGMGYYRSYFYTYG